MKKNKRIVSFLLAGLMVFSLTACGSGQDQTNQGASKENGKEAVSGGKADGKKDLILGIGRGITSIWPGGENDQGTIIMNQQFYNRLLSKNYETGELEPELAKSWEVSDDQLTLTFHLRDDVYFHNGDKMTAEDVAWTMNEWHRHETYTKDYLVFFNNAEATDEYTVVMHYDKVYAAALESLSFTLMGILDKSYVLDAMGDKWDTSDNAQSRDVYGDIAPNGTGPFKFVNKVSGESYTMAANENYFDGKPAFDTVTVKIMTDTNAALLALESGEIDALSHCPSSDKNAIENNPDLVWYENADTPYLIWFMLNEQNEYLANPKVRQAIAYALNKEEIAIATTDGVGHVISSPIPTSATGYSKVTEDYSQDIEKAKSLLAEAGYPDGFNIEIKTTSSNTYKKPSAVIQAQLAKIGINATVTEVDTYWSDVAAHDFDMGVMNLCIYVPDADQALYPLYYTGAKRNYVNVSIPDLDRLLDEARGEMDLAKRTELYGEIQQIFHDELFMIPLCNYAAIIAANKKLKNVEVSPVFAWNINEWTWEE